MANNDKISYDRQNEIAYSAARKMGLDKVDIIAVKTDTDGIPEAIDFSTSRGDFTRSIVPYYGELLSNNERDLLTQRRLDENSQNLESLNGVSNQLGKNKQPVVSSSSGDRVRAETLANPTFDPSNIRRSSAGLPPGAQSSGVSSGQPLVKFAASKGEDSRVRIVVPSGALQGILLNGPVLYPLAPTNGVLFPYTPSITVQHGALYQSENLTHSNYAYQFYQSSTTESISITATFACKNSADANYVVAAQHFFRTVTKMFYGQDAEAGLPPPVLRLEGHGDYQFGAHKDQVGGVPIVIESFSVTLPEDVDYISTNPAANSVNAAAAASSLANNGTITRVPIVQQFSITCRPLYSRKSITGEFGFAKFARGQLLATSGRGGFI